MRVDLVVDLKSGKVDYLVPVPVDDLDVFLGDILVSSWTDANPGMISPKPEPKFPVRES